MAFNAADIADRLRQGPASTPELTQTLAVSQPTLSRELRRLEHSGQVLRMGRTRGARYGIRRSVNQIGSHWPLHRIDQTGAIHELGQVNALERDHFYISAKLARINGLFEGLPYYLQDLRPAGFLGRGIPGAYPRLELPLRVADWTDAHVLIYLTQRGSECTGDLVIGGDALTGYLAETNTPTRLDEASRNRLYPHLADAALAGARAGSSAHGEQPKFTTCIEWNGTSKHVLVKFSPRRATASGERWADLLIAEHIAHRLLAAEGIPACKSEIVESGERVFLETERFDRVGAEGRLGAVSMLAVDTARYARLDNWTSAAERLAADRLLSREDAERVRFVDAFGALIANTDRHFGNITLFDSYDGIMRLAPVYDMLPMLFAPQNEQIPAPVFEPSPATAAWLPAWPKACRLAERYWEMLAQDARLTIAFRQQSSLCLEALRALPARGRVR